MDILKDFKINPYEILNIPEDSDKNTIKKAYKRKAKILHPDKTGNKSDADFKILYLCYTQALKNCPTVTSTFEEIKNVDRSEEKSFSRNFHRTNFEDQKTRNDIYADDDIDFVDFEDHMKRVQGMSTSYSPESFYKKNIMESMKTGGKFDKDKFNAYFLKLRKDEKIENSLVKRETLKASNEHVDYMSVNIHDDMVINLDNTKHKGNYRDLMKQGELSQTDIEDVLQTDIKTINKLIKEHKKDTGKISRKKMKDMESKKSEDVCVQNEFSFSEMKNILELENKNKIEREMEQQRIHVDRNKRIFMNRIM